MGVRDESMTNRAQALRRTVGLLAALLAASCGGGGEKAADAPKAVTPPGAPVPALRLYVSDETGGNVVIVDPEGKRVVERIAVGKRPRGLHLSIDGTQLFVALSGSPIAPPGVDASKLPPPDRAADGIGVVDLAGRRLARTMPSGQDPEAFDLSPDGRTLYLSNEETAEMSALDLATGTIRGKVKVGEEPEGVTVTPDGRLVYVTCEGDNEVVAVDTTTLKVLARMKTAARPRSIVFTTDGRSAFVTDENAASVTVLDAVAHKVATTIKLPHAPGNKYPPRPMGTTLSPDGRLVFVSLGRAQSIAVIDAASRTLVKIIEGVGERPWGIDVSPDGRKLFTANGPSQDVSIIDIESGKVDARINVGGSPWGLVVGMGR